MKFEKINYKKTFNLGNYSTHTIGVEIGLDEKDDPKLAIETASQLVHEYHRQSTDGLEHHHIEVSIIPDIQVEKSTTNSLETLIMNCKVLEGDEGLLSYKAISAMNPKLKKIYDKTFKNLNKCKKSSGKNFAAVVAQ